VRFIVQHGGNIVDTDGKGNTISHFAVANEYHDILKFLSKQIINLDVQNSDGDTPLLQAVREGRNWIVQYLVEKHSDKNTHGNDGKRPLDVVVLKGNMEITRVLLGINALSYKLGMHMFVAARFGFLDLLQRCVAIGEDINVKTEDGKSPLHVASKSGQVATVQYLSEHGAPLDLQDNSGNTALHMAVSNGHLEVTRVLVKKGRHEEVVRELLKYSASVNISNNKGGTHLNIASFNGHLM
jgi:ankyrin repeat protein